MDLSNNMHSLLLEFGLGIVTAVVVSYVTVRLSLNRFYSEKWWEKKVEAYSAILESLHHMKNAFDEDLDAEMGGPEIPDERKARLQKKFDEAHDELRKRMDVGQFVLSEPAVTKLAEFQKAYADAKNNQMWFDYLDQSWAAINTALEEMRVIAKTDLKGH